MAKDIIKPEDMTDLEIDTEILMMVQKYQKRPIGNIYRQIEKKFHWKTKGWIANSLMRLVVASRT